MNSDRPGQTSPEPDTPGAKLVCLYTATHTLALPPVLRNAGVAYR